MSELNSELFGFKIIGDMSTEELIEEIAGLQKGQLEQMNLDQLKSILVDYRAGIYRKRLIREAGFPDQTEY